MTSADSTSNSGTNTSGTSDNASTDDFLKSYISQLKTRLADKPVRPDAAPDIALLQTDPEAPADRRRFYTAAQTEQIAMEECAECEYAWRKCAVNPPTLYDHFFGCRKLRAAYYECMERVTAEINGKSGKEQLVPQDKKL
ncbi:hypothetical protein LPJ73_001005 [Coemansia sp. RSA 2703]|nr:hypothetical protein LPJ73_001005 [Coemansia sp. RSA 2703]KAJ2375191.1 hypothetical protein IW150_002685 [Coemansia sp. RSA 2607]KAJ2397089.1 hypothetical protein GGI05_000814 [Coemansia sp. RSA 2603]